LIKRKIQFDFYYNAVSPFLNPGLQLPGKHPVTGDTFQFLSRGIGRPVDR